jgi:hypothetical protein
VGLTPFTFDYVAAAVKRHAITGAVLTVAKMDMYFNLESLAACAAQRGFLEQADDKVSIPPESELGKVIRSGRLLSDLPHFRSGGCVSDRAAFAALGFDTVKSVDASDFEGADYIYDLNVPGLREAVGREFDLVIEAGTMEHVFHVPNALANMQSVVRIGGCILHSAPTNNSVDHGFYQFCPTLYQDYYEMNGWEILQIDLTCYERTDSPKFLTEPPRYFAYTPGSLDGISQGGLDEKMYGTWVLARRTPESTIGLIPTQGVYRKVWGRKPTARRHP